MKTLAELNPALQSGAYLIYVRSYGFLARQIQFWMRLYVLRFRRIWRKPVNHTDVMVNGIVCGAKFPVSVCAPFEEYYNDGKKCRIVVYRINPGVEPSMGIITLKYHAGIPYDLKNFIDFMYKFFTGKWKGRTGDQAAKKVYCIELSHMIMRELLCSPLMDESDWDNDPEGSRQWAIDNLELVGVYNLN